jgi:hypothetical protein
MNTKKYSFLLIVFGLLMTIISGCEKNETSQPSETSDTSLKATALNTVYIDPGYTGTKTGTLAQPFSSWTSVVWKDGLTCLIKAGSVITVNYNLRPTANHVTIGSYGTGNRPHIISTLSGGKILDVASLTDVTVQDLELESTNSALTCLNFMYNVRGKVINCKLHGATWGIRNLTSTGMFRITNSEIYMTGDDGCFISAVDSIELSGSSIHDVNQKYFINTAESYSGGDCFQMSDIPYFYIHNNTIDHGVTGNKFCIIVGGSGTVVSKGIIEHNTLIRQGGILLYMQYANNVIVRDNKFENSQIAIYNLSSNAQISYNEFSNITGNVLMLGAPTGTVTKFFNNTFYNINTLSNAYTNVVSFQNNIFSKVYGTLFVSGTVPNADYNCYNLVTTMGTASSGTHSIKVDPLFNNVSTLLFDLKSTSPCIGKGTTISGITSDIDGNTVPTASTTDIGAHEYSGTATSSTTNTLPVVSITSPGNGTNFTAPATVKLIASASDADGSIAKVDFYNGSVKIGSSTTSPYTFTWTSVPTGMYSVTAIATDNLTGTTTSKSVILWINK